MEMRDDVVDDEVLAGRTAQRRDETAEAPSKCVHSETGAITQLE